MSIRLLITDLELLSSDLYPAEEARSDMLWTHVANLRMLDSACEGAILSGDSILRSIKTGETVSEKDRQDLASAIRRMRSCLSSLPQF